MIPSPHHSARRGGPVRLVVLHTAEGSRTVESLGGWFQRPATRASSHAGIDDQRTELYVPYDRAAWTLRTGNSISDNVELCGFAKWTREQWLGQHARMLELCAAWIRERCQARRIPIRKLSPEQVAAGQAGVCGHYDWTVGMLDGSHTDPGPGFPWDHVIALAGGVPLGPASLPRLAEGDTGDHVLAWQSWLNRYLPASIDLRPRRYGPQTITATRAFQQRAGVTGSDADGRNVGPRTLAAAWDAGFRG